MTSNSILSSPLPIARSPKAAAAERRLEAAMIAMRSATDSRGLKIMLYAGPLSSKGLRNALRGLPKASGEPTYERNFKLLSEAYLAALEYERVASTAD